MDFPLVARYSKMHSSLRTLDERYSLLLSLLLLL